MNGRKFDQTNVEVAMFDYMCIFWVADKSSNYEHCIELFMCFCVCVTKFNQPLRFKKGSVCFAVSKNGLVKSFPFLETITIQITHPINCAGHVVRLSFFWKWKKNTSFNRD